MDRRMSTPQEVPAPKPDAPKFRYFTVPPDAVRLAVEDVVALLPAGAWIGSDADKRRELALPAAEILEKNYPRIRFRRLCDLLPGCIRAQDDAPEWIPLPTDRVALAYKPGTRSEPISESSAEEGAAPAADAAAVADKPAMPIPSWKQVPKPVLAPPPGEAAKPAHEPPPPPVPFALRAISNSSAARLQQIFMTEDALDVQRVVELAAELPGLSGCILVRESENARSPGAPAGWDGPELAAEARRLLEDAGRADTGLALLPALTLYAESGPVSFLRRGALTLLVAHRERGFLPGVREKLEVVLEFIERALAGAA
jgi:hypothetical protein